MRTLAKSTSGGRVSGREASGKSSRTTSSRSRRAGPDRTPKRAKDRCSDCSYAPTSRQAAWLPLSHLDSSSFSRSTPSPQPLRALVFHPNALQHLLAGCNRCSPRVGGGDGLCSRSVFSSQPSFTIPALKISQRPLTCPVVRNSQSSCPSPPATYPRLARTCWLGRTFLRAPYLSSPVPALPSTSTLTRSCQTLCGTRLRASFALCQDALDAASEVSAPAQLARIAAGSTPG